MFGKFLPHTTDFFNYFESHIEISIRGAQALINLVGENHSDQVASAANIAVLEKEGDEVSRQCIEALHKTFITPFERNDIYRLMTRMDDIMDAIEDVAAHIVDYKLDTQKTPLKSTEILAVAIIELKKVVLGMRKKESLEVMKPSLLYIHKLENEVDDLTRNAISLLFEKEKNPINLIKWKEIYEKFGRSNRLLSIGRKYSRRHHHG